MPKPKRLVWRIKQRNQKATSSSSSSVPPPPPPPPPWVELPREITADILRRVGTVEILLNAQRVCSTWWKVCHDPTMWRVIDMSSDKDCDRDDDDLTKMCQIAVDRSQGQLLEIKIKDFGDDKLLDYISQRSSQLRHIRLVCCEYISDQGLAAVAKNFPLLEELHIYLSVISTVGIEALGRSCSQLKSFTLNDCGFRGFRRDRMRNLQINVNDQALAIAANMPELRRLALFGNNMTNEGLCAILDGCPRLESLDLRHCYSIDLKGDLGTRCRQQIIDMKCPYDSTHDYEFINRIYDYGSSDDEYPSGLSEAGVSDYFYDYDFDDFDYDDFTNSFSSDYLLDEDGFFW
ncbi:F-box protein SKIP19-like [Lycium barbarum]|uniref:F-box protein SKIP19-like n=1 Tax=Lycium barbarum TaxID=112863 RepID=UPI00293F78C0|nr:F-box protein SKIP19-like [Lycium barbarum]XP_060192281.1 F-box protein SKIP19-like [Lycium barbarum]